MCFRCLGFDIHRIHTRSLRLPEQGARAPCVEIVVLWHFAVVAQKSFPTRICVQNLVGGCVGNFFFLSARALKKRGGFSIFSDLECPSGVRHINSADSAEIRGFGFCCCQKEVYVRCRRGAENAICANFFFKSRGRCSFSENCLAWAISHSISV